MNESALVDLFELYLKNYGSDNSHTAKAKKLDLEKFIKYSAKFYGYSNITKLHFADLDHALINRFVDESLKRESPATVARRLATIKHFGKTLAERVPGYLNPAKDVKSPKIASIKPKAPDRKTILNQLKIVKINNKNNPSFIRHRNYNLFLLMLSTGLRADEVRNLRQSQLSDHLDWINNVRTKGRKYRNVYIPTDIRKDLNGYLEKRNLELNKFAINKKISENLPVFISTVKVNPEEADSFMLDPKTIYRIVKNMCSEIKLHPHLLRHSFALNLLNSSKDIRLVSQALGHSDVAVTMRYTERTNEELAKALEISQKATK